MPGVCAHMEAIMWNAAFWKDAGERAIRTFAQVLVSFLVVTGVTVVSLDWNDALAFAGTAGVVSILMSVADPRMHRNDDDLARDFSYTGKHRKG